MAQMARFHITHTQAMQKIETELRGLKDALHHLTASKTTIKTNINPLEEEPSVDIPSLVRLVTSGTEKQKEYATGALCKLAAGNAANQAAIAAASPLDLVLVCQHS